MTQYFWTTKDGMACNISDGIQVWDTSLGVQALDAADAGANPRFQSTLVGAHAFLADHQLLEDVQDQDKYQRWPRKGGWPFSTRYQGYMISECTGEGLRSVMQLQEISIFHLAQRIPKERLRDAVDCLLNLQNDTGGFGVYEKRIGSLKLAWLEMGEFVGKTMVTYDHVECTTAAVSAVLSFSKLNPDYLVVNIEATTAQGLSFTKQSQKPNGGWHGAWGVCFTYAGMFALEALALGGETYATFSWTSRRTMGARESLT